jgi:hypothetical protein
MRSFGSNRSTSETRALQRETPERPNTRMQSDRFAREIVAFLTFSRAARSRRLMRTPLGGHHQSLLPIATSSATIPVVRLAKDILP